MPLTLPPSLRRPAQLTLVFALMHGVLDALLSVGGVLANPWSVTLFLALARLLVLSIVLSLVHLAVFNGIVVGLLAIVRRCGLAVSQGFETAILTVADAGLLAAIYLGVEYYDNQVHSGMPFFGPVTGYLSALAAGCIGALLLLKVVLRLRPALWRWSAIGAGLIIFLSWVMPYEPEVEVAASSEEHPNVIFFVVDTLRAKSMSLYGYERDTTPQLDAIARDSAMVFDRAYVQYTMSTASHASMYSGCYPFNHRAYGNGWTIPDEVTLLSEKFKEAGYHTAAFHNHAFLGAAEAFDQGFDTFVETHAPTLLNTRPVVWRLELHWLRAYEVMLRRETVRTLMFDWLDEAPRPFYLWLHTGEPHASYKPPRRLWTKFGDPDYSGSMDGKVRTSIDYAATATPEDVAHMVARYDGEVAWFDELYGRLIARLEELDIDDNTLVVLSSDHGECLGEHDCYFHHGELYEESVHVPLVLRYPDKVPAGRVNESVELVDAAPTILRLAGIDDSPRFCDGQDLSILWREVGRELPPAMSWRAHAVAAMDEESKLIIKTYPEGVRELYDLDADPGETRNLAAERPEETARLEAVIEEVCDSTEESLAVCLRTHMGRGAELSESALQKLRSLGYID